MRKRIITTAAVLFLCLFPFVIPASAAEPVTYSFTGEQTFTSYFRKYPDDTGTGNLVKFNQCNHLKSTLYYVDCNPLSDVAASSYPNYNLSLSFAFDSSSSFPLRTIRQGMQTHIKWQIGIGSNQVKLPGNVTNPIFSLVFGTSSGRNYTFPLDDYGRFYNAPDFSWYCEWDFILPAEIQGITSAAIVTTGRQSNTPLFTEMQFNVLAMTITQTSNNQDIIDEDYGYSKPSTSDIDDGVSQGMNILDAMNSRFDDFFDGLDSNTDGLLQNVQKVKPLIDGVFDIIPLPISLAVAGVVIFLVIRKVVGR